MPRRRSKRQQRLQGEGFWDTITSWGRTLRDYPKLIVDGPQQAPPGSTSSEGLPDKSILKTIADNSYKGTSDEMASIPGYTLKFKSPTLVIYQKDGENVMVIGVRGTADFRDFRAWFSTAFNVIPDSQRFKEDIAEISKFQQQYPLSAYTYYATGHSLGGTLIDELIKKGMVKEARTYNPAIETDDIPNVALSQKNHRIYADGDPLYLLQGRYDNPTEVRKSYKYYPSSVMDFVPGYDKYKQHILANPVFVGGEQVEMKPADYYKEHRNIVSLLDKTGKALQSEAQDQKMEAKQMAKKLGHANPFYHLRGKGIMANSQFYRTDPKRNPLLSGGDSMDFDNITLTGEGPSKKKKDPTYNWEYDPYDMAAELDLPARDPDLVDQVERRKLKEEGMKDVMKPQKPSKHTQEGKKGKRSEEHHQDSPNYEMPYRERRELIPYLWEGVDVNQMRAAMRDPEIQMPQKLAANMGQLHFLDQQRKAMERQLGRPLTDAEWDQLRSSDTHKGSAPSFGKKRYRDQYDTPPQQGRGILDDIKQGLKKGAEDIFGKLPERAELTPEQQADSRRRQWIQDVDKRRAEMVAKKKKYAMDNLMENAQHKNVLQAYYRSVGTDNPKDYLQKVVEMATKTAEEFYPYENFK